MNTLVFDLDGTLVDSAPDLTNALNWVLNQHDRASVPPSSVRKMVGDGAAKLIERGFAATGTPVQDGEMPGLINEFLDFYMQNLTVDTVLFDDVVETLDALKDMGMVMGVCTNKPIKPSLAILEGLGIQHYFGAVLGGDSLGEIRKPDPRHLTAVLEALESSVKTSALVGDSINDVLTAKNAGAVSIGVTFGYSRDPMETLEPDHIIDNFKKLLPIARALTA